MTPKKPIPPEVQKRIDLRKQIQDTYRNLKQVPVGHPVGNTKSRG